MARSFAVGQRNQAEANGSRSTRQQILEAASGLLTRDGLAALSTRAVADEAGVNLSLIHYHFSSRDGLLLSILEDMNAKLLERQQAMYDRSDLSLADKWQRAIDFYHQDLASGYVRILLELAAHGFSNEQMAVRVRQLLREWRELLTEFGWTVLTRSGSSIVTADELGTILTDFWFGMELMHMLGVSEEESPHWKTLDRITQLLRQLEKGSERDGNRPRAKGQH